MACSTCLWGTRRPTTAIIGVGSLPGRTCTTGSVPLCTTATRCPRTPSAWSSARVARETATYWHRR